MFTKIIDEIEGLKSKHYKFGYPGYQMLDTALIILRQLNFDAKSYDPVIAGGLGGNSGETVTVNGGAISFTPHIGAGSSHWVAGEGAGSANGSVDSAVTNTGAISGTYGTGLEDSGK